MPSVAVPPLAAAPLVEAGAHAGRFWARPRLLQPLKITLAVGLAYYVASIVGLSMRVPPATTSLMWPPNALLTSVLLLTPYRYWWACFLGAFLSHVVVQQGVGWPLGLIGLLFLTNCSEALIGAVGLRAVSDEPTRFDTLRRVVAFVAVRVVAGRRPAVAHRVRRVRRVVFVRVRVRGHTARLNVISSRRQCARSGSGNWSAGRYTTVRPTLRLCTSPAVRSRRRA